MPVVPVENFRDPRIHTEQRGIPQQTAGTRWQVDGAPFAASGALTWLTLAWVAMTYPPTTRMPRLEKGLVSHSHCEGEGHGVYWLRGMMRLRGGAKPAPTWLGRIHVKIPEGYTKDSVRTIA
eukprot:1394930-Amorphochlora_amoeboformis.AAC.2